ncbi:MAG: PIN domain-containing protein [Bacteroidia bacterium]|nr:PIN domain-containing protein [Bacteroidia bacterium]
MYLVDTNIWIERLLNQRRSEEIAEFLAQTYTRELFISDISLHSLVFLMLRFDKKNELITLLNDLFNNGKITVVSLNPEEINQVITGMEGHNLEYEDAYLLECARKYDLIIVTLNENLKKLDSKTLDPKEIIY